MLSGILDKDVLYKNLDVIIENLHVFVVALDPSGTVFYANSHFFKLIGYTDEEVIGKNWYKTFVPENKVDTVVKIIKAIIENKYSMESESPVLKKDGGQLIVSWHNFPLLNGSKVEGVISLGIDITSRVEIELLMTLNAKTLLERAEVYKKQNEELEASKIKMQSFLDEANRLRQELQLEKENVEKKVDERTHELNEEKARLIASIDSFPYGFLMTDNEGAVVVANEKLEVIFNVKKTEWQIEDIQDFLGESVDFIETFNQVKATKTPCMVKNIDLVRKFLDVYVAPVFLGALSDETIGYLVIVSDVTEQKVLERSKDEFFSIASHELRTPLTAIRGNIELIKKHFGSKINDNTFNEMVDDIHTSSQRLIGLVNEFLNMSRLEQGKLRLESEVFDPCPLINEVILELKTNASTKKLDLAFENPKESVPNVIADKNRVREILINLVSNAITYTDRGKVTVKVTHDELQVKVSVSDTGKGIPPQNQNMLFRKFQQANANLYTRDSSRSTGLGLYISRLMVESMGGAIFLEKTEVGTGSTFAFTLPIAQEKKRI